MITPHPAELYMITGLRWKQASETYECQFEDGSMIRLIWSRRRKQWRVRLGKGGPIYGADDGSWIGALKEASKAEPERLKLQWVA